MGDKRFLLVIFFILVLPGFIDAQEDVRCNEHNYDSLRKRSTHVCNGEFIECQQIGQEAYKCNGVVVTQAESSGFSSSDVSEFRVHNDGTVSWKYGTSGFFGDDWKYYSNSVFGGNLRELSSGVDNEIFLKEILVIDDRAYWKQNDEGFFGGNNWRFYSNGIESGKVSELTTQNGYESDFNLKDLQVVSTVASWAAQDSRGKWAYWTNEVSGGNSRKITADADSFHVVGESFLSGELGNYPKIAAFVLNEDCTASWGYWASSQEWDPNKEQESLSLAKQNAYSECYEGDVYSFDSCGNPVEVEEFCINSIIEEGAICVGQDIHNDLVLQKNSCSNAQCVSVEDLEIENVVRSCGESTSCGLSGECLQCSPGAEETINCEIPQCVNATKTRVCDVNGVWSEWPDICTGCPI